MASEGWPRKGGLGRWHFGSMWLHVVITVHTSSLDNSTLSEGGTWVACGYHSTHYQYIVIGLRRVPYMACGEVSMRQSQYTTGVHMFRCV